MQARLDRHNDRLAALNDETRGACVSGIPVPSLVLQEGAHIQDFGGALPLILHAAAHECTLIYKIVCRQTYMNGTTTSISEKGHNYLVPVDAGLTDAAAALARRGRGLGDRECRQEGVLLPRHPWVRPSHVQLLPELAKPWLLARSGCCCCLGQHISAQYISACML